MTEPSVAPGRTVLAGHRVQHKDVLALAGMLGGDALSMKLARGVASNSSIVALSTTDCQRILEVLTDPPGGLAELKNVLSKQLKQRKEREHRDEQTRINQSRRA